MPPTTAQLVATSRAVCAAVYQSDTARSLISRLAAANAVVSEAYPGDRPDRQPVHTVYGGAHLFTPDLAPKLGRVARRVLDQYGGDPVDFARAIGLTVNDTLAHAISERVLSKLEREPVEDFRIDFEDGYGNRPDDEEDHHAELAAKAAAKAVADNTAPPFFGIRIKPLSDELAPRSLRTLDRFVTTLVAEMGGTIPNGFVVTLPKITNLEQVSVLVSAFESLEAELKLKPGALAMEFMIETTQSLVGLDGIGNLTRMLEAANGRCIAAHFGTYDYTASCNITAAHQHMTHPACDFARHLMQIAYAGRGIWLSDGATNIMPVPVHAAKDQTLTAEQESENRAQVHAAWRLHAEHVRHSLVHGYYQGWDLHPAHLPTRYAAIYSFFLEGLDAASERLTNFIAKAAQATLVGDVFDDAATGQGLLNFFLRGIGCGAFGEEAALATGLSIEELRGRSFVQILKNRG